MSVGTPPMSSDVTTNRGLPIVTPEQSAPVTSSVWASGKGFAKRPPVAKRFRSPLNKSSVGHTPGDCMSLSMRALAAMNRVEYAEQVVGGGRDDVESSTMKSRSPASVKASENMAALTPRDLSNDLLTPDGQQIPPRRRFFPNEERPSDWLSPENESSSPGYKSQLTQLRMRSQQGAHPVVIVTQASSGSMNEASPPNTHLSAKKDARNRTVVLASPSEPSARKAGTPARPQPEVSPKKCATNSEMETSSGVVISVAGSNDGARWRNDSELCQETPSTHTRPSSGSRSTITESVIQSCAATTGSAHEWFETSSEGSTPDTSRQLPVYSIGTKIIKTMILGFANLTTALCLSILGPTIPGLMTSHKLEMTSVGLLITARSAGGVVGVILLYRYFDDVTPFMSMTLMLLVSGGLTAGLPFIPSDVGINVAIFFSGVCLAFLFCASGAVCFHIWSVHYRVGIFPSQIMLSVGLAFGPLLSGFFLPNNNVASLFNDTLPSTDLTWAEPRTGSLNTPPGYQFNATDGVPGLLPLPWSPAFPFYYAYLAAGGVQLFVGLLFMTLWLRTEEPTFQKHGTFDMVTFAPRLTSRADGTRARCLRLCVCVCVALLVMGVMAVEVVYQQLVVMYLMDSGAVTMHFATNILASHHVAYLLGRGLGCVSPILIGLAPIAVLCSLGTISAFAVQYVYGISSEPAIIGVAVGCGFCLGSLLPSVLYHAETVLPLNRQVATSILGCAYVSMTAFPVVTVTLMTSCGCQGFDLVLLMLSIACAVFTCAVFVFVERLRHWLDHMVPATPLSVVGINSNENFPEAGINMAPHANKRKKKSKKTITDANGNVVEVPSTVLPRGCRTRFRGKPISMMNIVSLGTRAVVGRW